MLHLIPGTVVEQLIGADAVASPEMVAQLKRFFGLDQPWHVQYGRWVGRLLHGDLRLSWRTRKPVGRLIWERLPVPLAVTGRARARFASAAPTTRAVMLAVVRSDDGRTPLAKGLIERVIVLKHALKSAVIPSAAGAGLQVGCLVGGPVVVEGLCTLPGVGRL